MNLVLNGVGLVADLSGALLWPERSLLVVADLHLEKGSAFAQRGQLLPPYDTSATLDRLAEVIGRTQPATVICLGDSFHDSRAAERIAPRDAARLAAMTAERDWIWITGNHDPEPPAHLGGRVAESVTLGPLCFRHEARKGPAAKFPAITIPWRRSACAASGSGRAASPATASA